MSTYSWEDRIHKLEDQVNKHRTYFFAATLLASAFGLAGAIGAYAIHLTAKRLNEINVGVDDIFQRATDRSKNQLETVLLQARDTLKSDASSLLERVEVSKLDYGTIIPNKVERDSMKDYSASIESDGDCKEGSVAYRGVLDRSVLFNVPNEFSETPVVFATLTKIESNSPLIDSEVNGGRVPVTIIVKVNNESTTGFNISVYTYCYSRIHDFELTWIALGR